MTMFRRISIFLLVILNVYSIILSQGCPVTDDPLPIGQGHWEINTGISIEHTKQANTFGLPIIDLNYGLDENIQLRYQIPHFVRHETGTSLQSGIGKSTIGVKWRFWDNKKRKFSFSFYPQISFNIPLYKGESTITSDGTDIILPVSCIKEYQDDAVVAEFGRVFNTRNKGNWLYGLLYFRQLSQSIVVAAEVFGISGYHFQSNELFLNLGTKVALNHSCVLLFAAGNNFIHNSGTENRFIGYIGLQLDI